MKEKRRDKILPPPTPLKKWNEGDLNSLIQEAAEEIQKRLNSNKGNKKKVDADQKTFVKLMLFGKVEVAYKRINNENFIKGVHQLNERIKGILQDNHPKGRRPNQTFYYQKEAVNRRHENAIKQNITLQKKSCKTSFIFSLSRTCQFPFQESC